MVHANGVSHRFGEREVFAPVEFTLRAGQCGIIRGLNGSGKSTLLRIVCGLLSPSYGQVSFRWDGRDLDPIARREYIGYVAPDLNFYRELTGVENLEFFAGARGRKLTTNELVVALEQVGLKGRGRDFVRTYSSGMRQRLKYAWTLLQSPALLVLDEPTANLDEEGAAMVRDLVTLRRSDPSALTLIATNEPNEVEWGDFIVDLRRSA